MNTLKVLTSPVGLALLPTATKSVGALFRYNIDYRNAPHEVRRNELKREVTLLSLAFLSNLAIQLVAVKTFPRLLPKVFPKLAADASLMQAVNLLSRFALAIPGTVLAEGLSRVVGKPPTWNEGKEEDEENEVSESPVQTRTNYTEAPEPDDDYREYAPKPAFRPISPTPYALTPYKLDTGSNPFASNTLMTGVLRPSLGYYAPQQPQALPLARII